ncbi:hypothetical protein [Salinisphaera sp. Q1T1-3]|uniref:hypothetical protein n=1 Tax=Salinisphaera sp. Q1T1-3 TaxID=2321229 RepID=UPI000E73A2B1|nr:hypothetical protein [Salinisphaera sp. Q1T1-3]RJS95273.1 hypothetical protein D3260_01600 [Salinisphaera sp. Q1T1-3]
MIITPVIRAASLSVIALFGTIPAATAQVADYPVSSARATTSNADGVRLDNVLVIVAALRKARRDAAGIDDCRRGAAYQLDQQRLPGRVRTITSAASASRIATQASGSLAENGVVVIAPERQTAAADVAVRLTGTTPFVWQKRLRSDAGRNDPRRCEDILRATLKGIQARGVRLGMDPVMQSD